MWSPPPLLTLPDWVLLGGDMVTRWSCRPAHDTGQPRPRHPHTTSALCQCQATPIITRGPELPWTQLTSTPPYTLMIYGWCRAPGSGPGSDGRGVRRHDGEVRRVTRDS